MIAAYGHRSLLYSVSTQLQERSKSHLSYEVGQAKLVVCFYSIFKTFFFKHENQDGGIVLIPVQVVKIVPPAARVSTVPVPYCLGSRVPSVAKPPRLSYNQLLKLLRVPCSIQKLVCIHC